MRSAMATSRSEALAARVAAIGRAHGVRVDFGDPVVGPAGIRETARLGIHHEFSSLILPRLPGLEAQWAALLPGGWRTTEKAAALGRTGAADGHNGFLSACAATSAENDFNTYAETAFGNPSRLLALAARLELVRRKASLLLGAYVALDARMETAFRHLGFQELPFEPPGAPVLIPVVPSHLPQPVLGGD